MIYTIFLRSRQDYWKIFIDFLSKKYRTLFISVLSDNDQILGSINSTNIFFNLFKWIYWCRYWYLKFINVKLHNLKFKKNCISVSKEWRLKYWFLVKNVLHFFNNPYVIKWRFIFTRYLHLENKLHFYTDSMKIDKTA